jgi:hypothetical protein
MGIFNPPSTQHLSRFCDAFEDKEFLVIANAIYHPNKTDEEVQEAYEAFNSDIEGNVLQKIREELSARFSLDAYSYIEAKYPAYRQQMLQALYTKSVQEGLTNRASYLQSLVDWCSSIVSLSIQADEELEQALTEEELFSVTVDYSSLDATDPNVTIKAALLIND